ncbi:creatininase family protein [Paenibacillus roseipurpureus]|uniref:Creatininase family protein n=1 Tax=Paenibacillus roseopurpureus TaxID=2918901 RepID=A0AA96LKN9_9BACL|nr:creatininase family protein [Paenibacillus sp. MBLB1832]WNR42841.1 creatininase family protein [Paenibacillus sp. MBLB1832]
MGYHVHESGPSARFLEEKVGEVNPFLSAIAPHVYYHFYLYQLQAFHNAGFRGAVVLSGHGGAHAADLKNLSQLFTECTGMQVWYGTDFDLTAGVYAGDHAGQYEISTLMHLHPELVESNA